MLKICDLAHTLILLIQKSKKSKKEYSMYSVKKLFLLLSVLVFSTSSLFAQSSGNASSNVTIQLRKGLTISNLDGDLDYGEVILTGNAQTETITPDNGVKFEVTGHPNKSVLINYTANTLTDGGTNSLTFVPAFKHTLDNPAYVAEADVVSGNSYILTPSGGVGKLYLWLGGDIDVAGAAEVDYTGAFNVTVAY